jgi:hypothetical protein
MEAGLFAGKVGFLASAFGLLGVATGIFHCTLCSGAGVGTIGVGSGAGGAVIIGTLSSGAGGNGSAGVGEAVARLRIWAI